MKPHTFFTVSNVRMMDPQTGIMSDLPPIARAVESILPHQADGKIYGAGDLSSFGASSTVMSASLVDNLLGDRLKGSPFCALVISMDGEEKGKAVIRSRGDLQTLLEGGEVNVSWYRKAGDDWEFMERRPMSLTRKSAE